MVNVAGRSKGCSTCRKRRVKCDETRPVCKRCDKSGLQCDGPRNVTFVEGKIVASRRTQKRPPLFVVQTPGYTSHSNHQAPISISLSGYEIDTYLCYALKHLRGGPVDLALQRVHRSDIITARQSTNEGRIFHQAILSFAAIFFGIQHKRVSITNEGYAILGTALSRLNQALSDPRTSISDDVILSVVTLALLESFVPTSPQQYLNHMLALERLLELRGPSSLSPRLIRGVRYMILFASMRTRKSSILAQAEWKTVLRMDCSDAEMQEQDLFDVLADCTVLATECDKMSATRDKDLKVNVHHRERVEQTALTLLFYLHAWRLRWDRDEKNSYVEVPWSSSDQLPTLEPSTGEPHRTFNILEFSGESSAIMLMLYNTALICVLQVLVSVSCEAFSTTSLGSLIATVSHYSGKVTAESEDDWVAAERSAALEICRCIPYVTRQSHVDLRVIHLALTTVWTTIRADGSAEGRWMRKMLNSKGQELIARGLRPGNHDNVGDFKQSSQWQTFTG